MMRYCEDLDIKYIPYPPSSASDDYARILNWSQVCFSASAANQMETALPIRHTILKSYSMRMHCHTEPPYTLSVPLNILRTTKARMKIICTQG